MPFPTSDYSPGWSEYLTRFHEQNAGADHFIDRASRAHALGPLARLKREPAVVIDVGCSSGFMLRMISEQMPRVRLIGADFVSGPLEQLAARMPQTPLLQFDLTKCSLNTGTVDAVILLNVLEHIEDDGQAIRETFRILREGGIAVVEVPAGPDLYDVYDKLLMHHRRYSLARLCEIAKNVGFDIIEQSHLGFFLYPGFWFTKQRNKKFLTAQTPMQERLVAQNIRDTKDNRLFDLLMRIELHLGKWIRYPCGIRCLMTLKKPSKDNH